MGKSVLHIIVAAIVTIFLAGCPSIWNSTQADKEPSPEELYKRAREKFEKQDYNEAIDLYERLKSAHPDFEHMPEVYERIADSFFNLDKYEEAIARYKQFMELYPNHEDKARAEYMCAMAYFKQIKDTDRDSTMARRAAQAFKTVIDEPDAGEWKEKAEEKYREARRKLGEKELYKARTYRNYKRYRAARVAAQRVLDQYGDLGLDEEAKKIIESVKDE